MMHRPRFISIAACFMAAAGVASLAATAGGSAKTRKFTLVYNVNNSGYFDVCGCKHKEVRQGSLTRRSTFLKQLRATGREILLLDGGSSLFEIQERLKEEQYDEAVRKAELIVESYNRMGYRAMAVGAYDLAGGLDTLKKLEAKAKFKFLSANLADKNTGKLHFEPHTIFDVNGIKVGVFGLTLETLSRSFMGKVAPDAVIHDPFEAARKAYDELRPRADIIIALSHLREETNFELVKQLKGLEILIDPNIHYGNHSTWIKEEEWLSRQEETVFLRSDGQGARLGVVDVELVAPRTLLANAERIEELEALVSEGAAGDAERGELARLRGMNPFRFTRVSIEPHHLTDPDLDHLIDEWKKNIDLSRVAHLEEALPKKNDYLTHAACKSCHEEVYAFWKQTPHAHAYASLKETGDEHRYDCVGCHTLGYGQAFLDTSNIGNFADVQCESCHGTNPQHVEDPKVHTFGRVRRTACISCHNEDQTRTKFDFGSARAKVACRKG
jgi:hypothetical protein